MLDKLLLATLIVCQVWASTDEKQKLLAHLLKHYSKAIEPDTTPLTYGMMVLCANLVDDDKELSTRIWESMFWKDNRLTWTPSEHGDIEQLRVPAELIWVPDMKLYNGIGEIEEKDSVNVVVRSDGSIIWIPIVNYRSHCSAQDDNGATECELKVGSWTYDANMLTLEAAETGVDLSSYLDTCPYKVSDAELKIETKTYPCCPEPYSNAMIKFKVTRN